MEGVLTSELKRAVLSQCGESAEEIANVITKFIEAHSTIVYKSGFGSSSSAAAPSHQSDEADGTSGEDDIGMDSYYSVGSGSGADDGSMSSEGMVASRKRSMEKLLRMNIRGVGDQNSGGKGERNSSKRRREEKDYPVMSTVRAVALVLVAKLRVIRCPHTETLPVHSMRQWDSKFLTVLLYSVFREYPSISWNRLMCQLMDSDLNDLEPYDGSQGPVAALYAQSLELPHHVHDVLMETLNGSRSAVTPSLMERLSPPSPQVSLAFRAPSSLLLSESLGGWTLLHYLAATSHAWLKSDTGTGVGENKEHSIDAGVNRYRLAIQQLMTLGIRIGEPDFDGRTPLHVAAGNLNVGCVQALITLGASVACLTYGRTARASGGGAQRERLTPLDELLRASGRMKWASVCTGPQLAQAVVALSGADVKALWSVTTTKEDPPEGRGLNEDEEKEGGEQASSAFVNRLEGFERNPLARIVRLGEATSVKALVSRSLLCPHGEWNLPLIRHLVMISVKAGRAWAVEYLWEAYSPTLDGVRPSTSDGAAPSSIVQEWVAFWHACLSACIISRTEGLKDVLCFLLKRPQALRHKLLRTSLMPQEQRITLASELDIRLAASFSPFLHLVILREDHAEEEEGRGDVPRGGTCSGRDMLDLLLASGLVGVSHILGTWTPLSSILPATATAPGTPRDIEAQLTALWLPSLYRYSSAPKGEPTTGASGSGTYQRRKRSGGARVEEVLVGLEPHGAVTAFCDVSPLSLAAFTGENALLDVMLAFLSLQPLGAYAESGGAAEVTIGGDGGQDHFDTHGEGGAYTHRLSAQLLNSLAVSPIVACTLSCNAQGLRLFKSNMGAVSFARACNQPDASGVVAVAAVMQMLGRVKREVGLGRAANSHEGALAGSQSHAAVRKHFREMHALAARRGEQGSDASASGHSLSLSASHSLSLSSADLELSLLHLDASFSVSLSSDGRTSSKSAAAAGTGAGVYHGKPFIGPEVWDPDGSALWALASTRAVMEVSSILLDNLTVGPVMFRRPSQRGRNVEHGVSTATVSSGSDSGSGSGSSVASGSFISTAKVWRLRERGLRGRIEQINHRLFTLVHTSLRGNPLEPYRELPALEVAQWIEHQMQRPAALGGVNTGANDAKKPNLLQCLAASLRHWQDLHGRLTASAFASSLRALRSLYRPVGASSRSMDKLLQAVVLLLDPRSLQGDNGSGGESGGIGAGQQRGRARRTEPLSVTTWKKARAALTGPESCSRKAVNRYIDDSTTKMLSYGNPFVSPLVSGSHSEGNPHVKAGKKGHNDRVVPYDVYTKLRSLISAMPSAFTEEHVSSNVGKGDDDSGNGARSLRVRDRVRVGRVLDCVNVLLGWVRAVLVDGEVVWGPPFDPHHGGPSLSTVEISGSAGHSRGATGIDKEHSDRSSGITSQDDLDPMALLPRTRLGVLEAVTLTEGRTRLHQALAHVPSYMYDHKDEEEEDDEDEEDYYYEDLEQGLLPLYINTGEDSTTPGAEGAGDAIDSRAVVWSEEEEREGRGYDLKWIQAIKEASATALLSLLLTAQGPSMGEGHGLLRVSRRAEAAAAVPVLLRSLTRLVKHTHHYGIYGASSSQPSRNSTGASTPSASGDSGGRDLMRTYICASSTLPPKAKIGIASADTSRVASWAGTRGHADDLLGGAGGASAVFERVARDLLHMMVRVSSAPVPLKHEIASSASGVEGQQGMPGVGTDVNNLAPVAITAQVPAHMLLSLVAQGLYSAATQLLDACATHQLCLVHGDGSLVVGRPSPFSAPSTGAQDGAVESSSLLVEVDAFLLYGVPATATTTTWDQYDAFSFTEANPLHIAVRDNSPQALCFAQRYLEVFVDAKLEVATLLPFLPDDPHSPTSGTSNATLELVLSRLARLTAYQTTELSALYYVHGISELGPRLHGVLTAPRGGTVVGAAEGQSTLGTSPEASLANTSNSNTASRFGSSRFMPWAHNYVDKAPSEGEGKHSPMGGVRRGGILTVPRDYELALSLHLAKALRRAVLLALADNAAVAARYWKIGHSEEEKNKHLGKDDRAHTIGGAMHPSRPPRTPSGKGSGSASKPSKPPRKVPRMPNTGATPAPLANAGGQSRFVLQLESQGGALVEIPQAAGPMQGLCVVPRHIWEGHERGTKADGDGESALGDNHDNQRNRPAGGAGRYEHLTAEVLMRGKREDGHGRGPLSRFYSRQRKPFLRGSIAASSSVLPPFSSDDILSGMRSRRKRSRRRARAVGPDGDVGISLMDGSVVPWRLFHLSLYNLLRATPLPALATGVNDTGLGVLHTIGNDNHMNTSSGAASLDAVSSALTSLPAFNATRRLLRTLGGKPRVLSITDTGLSPVFASLVDGGPPCGPDRFQLANILLREATKDASAVVPALTSEQPLMKVPLSISQQYARHSVIAVSQKAPMLLLEQARARRILAEREYIGLQLGGLSLATVTKPMDLLVLLMRETERVWSVLRKEDLTPLLRFSRGLGEHETMDVKSDGKAAQPQQQSEEPIVLDSLQRARRILALLKVPFSSLEEGVNKDRDEATFGAGSAARYEDDTHRPFTHVLRSAAFDSVSPTSVRSKVSLGAAQQLKAELLGWFETRGVIREHYPHLGHSRSHDDGDRGENKDPNSRPGRTVEATPDEETLRRRQLKWSKFGKYGISLSFPALLEDCLALRQWLHLSFIDLGEAPATMTHILNPAVHSAAVGSVLASSAFHVTSDSSGSGTFTERLYSGVGSVSSSFRDNKQAAEADSTPGGRYRSFLERSYLGFDDLSRRVASEHGPDRGEGSRSPDRPLGLFSHASYSLMSQLVAETRRSSGGSVSGAGHDSRPYASYHASAQRKATQALLSFLHKHRKHPHLVRAALRQAYIVLDLARMLYLCRSLITATQTVPEWARYHVNEDGTASLFGPQREEHTAAGSRSVKRHKEVGSGVDSEKATHIADARVFAHQTAMYRAAVVHPLDVIYRRLQSFKEYESGMYELVQRAQHAQRRVQEMEKEKEKAGPTPVVASAPSAKQGEQQASSRAEALLAHARYVARDTMAATDKHLRMKLCDLLSVEDLALFLRLDETISPRYYDFKMRVWRGIRALAVLKGDPIVETFLARLEHLIVAKAPHGSLPDAGAAEGASEGISLTRVKTSVTSASLLALPLEPPSGSADEHGLNAAVGAGTESRLASEAAGPDAAKLARMSRGSGLRALLEFLKSFSLRDVLSVEFSGDGGAGGAPSDDSGAAGPTRTPGLEAILSSASELSAFEKSSPASGEETEAGSTGMPPPGQERNGGKTPAKAVRTKTTSHGITKTVSENKGGEKTEKVSNESPSVGTHGHSAGGNLFEDLESRMKSTAGDRPTRKSAKMARAGHTHGVSTDGNSDSYSYEDMSMGLSAKEKRLMHGVTPTEDEVIDIEALVDAPPVILKDLLQKIETKTAASASAAGAGASATPIKPGGDGVLPVRTLAQNYTMRSALLDDLHAAYRTANAISWLLQALAGVHSRQLFFEPLVRDWAALAKRYNPLVVTPLAFSAPARQLSTTTPSASGGAIAAQPALHAPSGPAWGLSNSVKLLQPLVTRQVPYLRALGTLLRKADAGGSESERRLALGSVRGMPLRLSTYPSLSSLSTHLLSSTAFYPSSGASSHSEDGGGGSHSTAPFSTAALTESLQSSRYLLELGCDPASPDGTGRVALSVAALAGRADMVAEFLEYCSDRQLRALFKGDIAVSGVPRGHRYLVWHVLMAAPAPPCATGGGGGGSAQQSSNADDDGNYAARGHEEVVKMLLGRGFPLDSPQHDGASKRESAPATTPAPPHPHLPTPIVESAGAGTAETDSPSHMLSCLQLAILKRLPRACIAVCSRMTGEAVPSADLGMSHPTRLEHGFPSTALVTIWPQVKLHVVAEVLQATAPAAADSGPSDTAAVTTSALPVDVGLRSVLPPNVVSSCRRHAAFMSQQLGCEQEGEREREQVQSPIPNTGTTGADSCRTFLLRDTLLTLAATLVNTYAPSPLGRSARHGECPLWRAARASVGTLLGALQDTLTPTAAPAPAPGPAPGAGSPLPYAKGHSHGIDRMTPGKRLNEDNERRRSSLDKALQTSVEELQLLHAEWTDEGRYYEGKWSVFHFAVSSARADITSMLFRRFHLYASRGVDGGPEHRYPSPSQLALLACFYDHPQAIMAVMLYASSYAKAASASASVEGTRARRAITQLYLGEFLNEEGTFPQALSLTAMSRGGDGDSDGTEAPERDDEGEGEGAGSGGGLFSKIAKVTPLEVAVHYGSRAALKYLCEVGVRIPFRHLIKATLAGSVDEANLVHLYSAYFASNKDLRNTETVDIAPFSSGSSPAVIMRRGLSSMFVAPEMARQRALINAPLPLSVVNTAGKKTAGVAVASGAVSGKATVHAGETLLHLCARRGHAALTALLLEYGANVRIRDDRGHTPLHTSVSFGSAKVTSVLASEQPRLTRAVQYLSIRVRAHLLRKARLSASAEVATTLPSVSIADAVTLESRPSAGGARADPSGVTYGRDYEADSDISSLVSSSGAGAGGAGAGHYEPSLTSEEASEAPERSPGGHYEPSLTSSSSSSTGVNNEGEVADDEEEECN